MMVKRKSKIVAGEDGKPLVFKRTAIHDGIKLIDKSGTDLTQIDKRLEYYIFLLNDPDLFILRKHENIPAVVAIQLLSVMRDDVAELKKEIQTMLNTIMKLHYLDEMEELITKNLNAFNRRFVSETYKDDMDYNKGWTKKSEEKE